MPTNICAFEAEEGSYGEFHELSSPEEFDTSTGTSLGSALDFSKLPTAGKAQGLVRSGPLNPLLTEGVFPYQGNPVAAVISAGLTLAFMSLKETGKIDINGIMFLLNSTDLYVGLAGSAWGSMTQKGAAGVAGMIGRGAQKLAPEMLKPLAQKEALAAVSNIVNGFTYTFSVSAGYEVFSQFWKIATKNIPEARTITGFFQSDSWVKRRVLLNLMYYTIIDKNLQKRVFDSIYYHRVMTFEFIAMNVGLYVGAQLGSFVTKKYMPGNVWAQRLGPTVGSITGGVLAQMIPNSWKFHFNDNLLSRKISGNEARLKELQSRIKQGINDRLYPARSNRGTASYWMSGFDLEDDIERIFATRDLLMSFYMQRALSSGAPQQIWTQVNDSYSEVQTNFESQLEDLSVPEATLSAKIQEWIAENKTPEEIQRLSTDEFKANPKREYYKNLLNDAVDRSNDSLDEIIGLQAAVRSDD